MKPKYLPYIFMSPAILLLLFIYGGPNIGTIILSMTNWDGISNHIHFIGFQNYLNMLHEKDALVSLFHTIEFLIITLVFQNVIALLLALLLINKLPSTSFFRSVFFLPSIINIVAIGLVWSLIFDPINGPIAYIANNTGWNWLGDIKFLTNVKLVMLTISFVNIWQWAGWNMVVYIAGLQSIPKELYEASSIDGASRIAKFKHITIPMLAPAITINIVMTTIGGLKVFELPFIMTSGGPGHASETLSISIVNNSFYLNKVGYGSAMSLILFILIIIVTLFQNKLLSRAEEAIQ